MDRKTWVPAFQTSAGLFALLSTEDQFQRQSAAISQNPGCIGVLQVTNEMEKNVAEEILRNEIIDNILVEVSQFY